MPRFVSVLGKFHPAMERVVLPLTQEDLLAGKSPVYDGPDRGALAMMVEQGYCAEDPDGDVHYSGEDEKYKGKRFKVVDYPGINSFEDEDRLEKVRTMGFNSLEEYMEKRRGLTKDKLEAIQLDKLAKYPLVHSNPTPRPGENVYSGLKAVGGNGPYKEGGFGDRPA